MSDSIKILDTNTANKVAAGEVVERPASVVKELVENSIDAGASVIEIETEQGGMSLIRVSDNGCGMTPADAELSVRRHATSKIRSIEDLFTIDSLGFRGEALPSIAAVSKFTLDTRDKHAEFATVVSLSGGTDLQLGSLGRAIGTSVTARDLFFNVPARRKFVKTDSTEHGHITNMLTKIALARNDIAIRYKHNGKLILNCPGNGSLFTTIAALYGKDVAAQIIEVSYAVNGITVYGYIGKPSLIRSNRAWQTFCVNRRVITNKMLFRAMDNAYHSLLPRHGYCFAVLLIALDPAIIDINVHPQKSEIKFSDEQSVYSATYKAVSLALTNPESIAPESTQTEVKSTQHTRSSFHAAPPRIERYSQKPLVELEPIRTAMRNAEIRAPKPVSEEEYCNASAPQQQSLPADSAHIEIYGNFANTFILASVDGNLLLIDQHAAHERIIYDKLTDTTERIPSQQLLINEFVELSPQECTLAIAHALDFFELGYTIELSSPTTIRISEIPVDMTGSTAAELFLSALKYLQEHQKPDSAKLRHEFLQTAACRAAIMSGAVLDRNHMFDLVTKLLKTKSPYTCPHGRPTSISFSQADLYKMFKRT